MSSPDDLPLHHKVPDRPEPSRQSLVIVGAGMATHALLRRLVQQQALDHYQVTVIGEEPRPCYDRVHLTECFAGKTADDLLLDPASWYVDHDIDLITGDAVTRIERETRTVHTAAGVAKTYHRLVLATGSRPFVPPIEGVNLPGVFVYRTIEDIERIKDYAAGCQTAAVFGGGLLGLEAGKALHDLELETHILEVAPSLMPRQLNAEAGVLLKQEIEKLGVQIHLLRGAKGIEDLGGRKRIFFDREETLEVDMIVISAGIRPRDELAREANLAIGERGGIAVDRTLRTADPRIHAIGECASFEGNLYGLVGPCYDMAEVVAKNLAAMADGEAAHEEFRGASQASRLKLMGVDVSTLGIPIGKAAGASLSVTTGEGYCRSLMIENKRLIGAIGVGPWPERERLSGAIAEGRKISQRQLRHFKEHGALWSASEGDSILDWPAAATVCSCLNVTRGELSDALLAGCTEADALAEHTGASTVCGSCRDLLCELAGQPQAVVGVQRRKGLLIASVLASLLVPVFLLAGPFPFAESVQSSWRQVDYLWQDSFAKQVSGFSLLGISVLALGFSLRKRIPWFSWGDFASWRGLHGILGTLTLVGFLVHTGLRLGHNFTLALAIVFLMLNLLGAFTGITAALESHFAGVRGRQLRGWRPKLTQLHIWLFWPLPALVLFHIISVYYY